MRFLPGTLLILVCGCITPQYIPGQWPTGMPAESFYQKMYDLDEENQKHQPRELYLTWILRFYKGYSIAPGWHPTEASIYKDMTDEQYRVMAPKMDYLGQIMSAEWAKSEQVRRINTGMLQIWAGVMRKALKIGRMGEVVDRVLTDVESLLRSETEPKAITFKRYKDLLKKKEVEDGVGGSGQ